MGSDSHWHWLSQGSTESRGKRDFTSFAEDAINAVLGLLVAFLHLFSFQLSLLFLAFPKLAPKNAADGAHLKGECRAVTGSSPAAPRGSRDSPASRVPPQSHWPVSLAHRQSGLRAGSLSLPSPRGFHAAPSRTGLLHGHSGFREFFFPPSPHGG